MHWKGYGSRFVCVCVCVCVRTCLLPQNLRHASFIQRKQGNVGFFVAF